MKRPWLAELARDYQNVVLRGDDLDVSLRLTEREPGREILLRLSREQRAQLRASLDWADAYGAEWRGETHGGREI